MVEKIKRRDFLKTGAGLAAIIASPIAISKAEEVVIPATGKPKAMLVDVRRCIGCKSCQVACKEWNKLPAEKTKISEAEFTNPPKFSSISWNVVTFKEMGNYDPKAKGTGGLKWRAISLRCMHCLDPQCVSVCPTNALIKHGDGPVVYDASRCVGCDYCMMACPWHVVHLDEKSKLIGKCTMCVDRIEAGMEPSCVAACPTDSLQFGDRDLMLEKAHDSNAPYIYGEKEAGGTSMICVSDVPFEEFGLPNVSPDPPSTFNLNMLKPIAGIGAIVGIISFLGYFMHTRTSKISAKSPKPKTSEQKKTKEA